MLAAFLVENGLARGAGAEDNGPTAAAATTSPSDPPARSSHALSASSSETVGSPLPRRTALAAPSERPRRLLIVAVVALSAVGLTFAALQRRKSSVSPQRQSLAILGFRNLSGQTGDAWLSTGLKEMLGSELRASKKLRTLGASEVARMVSELGLADADPMSKDVLARIHKDLQASLVLHGSYTVTDGADGRRLRLDLQVQDCTTGELVSSVAENGTEANLFDLVASVGKQLREQLAPGERALADRATVRAALPTSVDAARPYAAGLAKLRAGDAMAARDLLLAAVAADETHALSHLALAQAWTALGYDSKAQDEAKRALALAAPLTREQRLWIEAFYQGAGSDWPNAIKTYQQLFAFDPDNVEYGLALANAQIRGIRYDAALETLDQISKLSPGASEDPRVDIVRAEALVAHGQLQKGADMAMRAAANARTRGADLLVARAEIHAEIAYARLGQCDKVKALEADGARIFSRVNDRLGITQLKAALSMCLRYHGDEVGSIRQSQEILKTCEDLGARKCMGLANNDIGTMSQDIGRHDEALLYFERAVAIFREINNRPQLANSLVNLAVAHLSKGDALQARRIGEEGIDILKHTSARLIFCQVQHGFAFVLGEAGDLGEALRMHDSSLALAHELGEKGVLADLAFIRAQILFYEGKLEAARSAIAECQRLYRELGNELWPAFYETKIGLIDLEEGSPKAAEAHARAAIERLEKQPPENVLGMIPAARVLLAQSLLGQGQLHAARAELDRALAPHEPMFFSYREMLSIARARLLAAEGHGDAAQDLLEQVRADAARGHYLPVELEARRAELEIRAATAASRRAQASIRASARDLRSQASKLGFGLIAKKMDALAGAD
jgi:tetratricopeptide (TPR) repeat protein